MCDKTILIVDDVASNLDILVELLYDYDVVEATSGEDALEILKEEKIDIILLDIVMPKMDGYEVCKILKLDDETKDIPVIFITAKTDENSIVEAYDAGGIDYITKPFKSRELLARINRELKMQELIYQLKKSQDELKFLSSIDPLTKLYNRRYFAEASKQILSFAKRDKNNLSIIMLDIDKFKNINDTYGHQVGDDILVLLASKLQELTRDSDIICRFGGEEFLVLFPDTSMEGAYIISQKIRLEIENMILNLNNIKELKITVSIGVSEFNHKNDESIEGIIKRADIALYKAKDSGRNKVCV